MKRAAAIVDAALHGTDSRRALWTDRDYLVHVLAYLTDADCARKAAFARPQGEKNVRTLRGGEPWWQPFLEQAQELDYGGADDAAALDAAISIRQLVETCRALERRLGVDPTADPADA